MKGALDIQVIFASWPKGSYGKRAVNYPTLRMIHRALMKVVLLISMIGMIFDITNLL